MRWGVVEKSHGGGVTRMGRKSEKEVVGVMTLYTHMRLSKNIINKKTIWHIYHRKFWKHKKLNKFEWFFFCNEAPLLTSHRYPQVLTMAMLPVLNVKFTIFSLLIQHTVWLQFWIIVGTLIEWRQASLFHLITECGAQHLWLLTSQRLLEKLNQNKFSQMILTIITEIKKNI